MDENQSLFSGQVSMYRGELYIEPAEAQILRLFRGRWQDMDVLDIGVGAGRTAFIFAAIARTYVGIDYSEEMIKACKEDVGESEGVQFLTCDA